MLEQLNRFELLESAVSKTVLFSVLFPNGYRYYFDFIQDSQSPIFINHPFRLYFQKTISVEWAHPSGVNGVYLVLGADPAFSHFGSLVVQVYISQAIYDEIVTAFQNPIDSLDSLVPPPEENTFGEVEFVLLSTDKGEQVKVDLVNTHYVPEIPVTVETLQWREVLYWVMNSMSFDFVYTLDGKLSLTFIDTRYCFLRTCVSFPDVWAQAIKTFAGV
jgi:hypothetical protein